ncbi:TPA: hypothetical protein N0F65_005446 [Lagenidium giganteum]|uniref:Chromo domain-containing protein n=1 Tax=Lagenidium giganteum TaxID=4803 RepID=A0AAV2Z1K6_9STRA|nr:TPA: hypothetical protein N0F65_005446 [Lagenidium giganteum]
MKTHPVFYVGRLKPYEVPGAAQYPVPRSLKPGRLTAAAAKRRAYDLQDEQGGRADAYSRRADAGDHRSDTAQGHRPQRAVERSLLARTREHEASSPAPSASLALPTAVTPKQPLRRYLRAPPAGRDSTGHQRFVVERLLKEWHSAAGTFFVRWRGYPPSEDSWEPVDILEQDVPDLVEALRSSAGATSSAGAGATSSLDFFSGAGATSSLESVWPRPGRAHPAPRYQPAPTSLRSVDSRATEQKTSLPRCATPSAGAQQQSVDAL